MITAQRLQEIRSSLDNEDISYGEIIELDNAAKELGIEWNDDRTATDTLLEIENKLNIITVYQG